MADPEVLMYELDHVAGVLFSLLNMSLHVVPEAPGVELIIHQVGGILNHHVDKIQQLQGQQF